MRRAARKWQRHQPSYQRQRTIYLTSSIDVLLASTIVVSTMNFFVQSFSPSRANGIRHPHSFLIIAKSKTTNNTAAGTQPISLKILIPTFFFWTITTNSSMFFRSVLSFLKKRAAETVVSVAVTEVPDLRRIHRHLHRGARR